MKKIIVIGCPGSGKSTFSRSLHKIINIPLYHLDMMYWNEDKTTVDRVTFVKSLSEVIARDEWIIDGNYASTLKMRADASDTIIFLDYPTELCLEGVRNRRGTKRSDIPWVESEEDSEFIEFIKNFETNTKPDILNLLNEYKNKNIYVFKSRTEADGFLSSL